MAEVQMLVVRMERRHIQEMFNRESQYSLPDSFDLDGRGKSSVKNEASFLACILGGVFLSYGSHWDSTEFGGSAL